MQCGDNTLAVKSVKSGHLKADRNPLLKGCGHIWITRTKSWSIETEAGSVETQITRYRSKHTPSTIFHESVHDKVSKTDSSNLRAAKRLFSRLRIRASLPTFLTLHLKQLHLFWRYLVNELPSSLSLHVGQPLNLTKNKRTDEILNELRST